MSDYHDAVEQHSLQDDIAESISFLLQHAGFIEKEQWARMVKTVAPYFAEEVQQVEGITYDANFSMADELRAQIMAVRAVRDRIMTVEGNLVADISTREAKEVISSGSTLVGTLMKYHEKVVNMERLRVLEQSVIEALVEADVDIRDQVLSIMEQKLAGLT
jgi:hypothetical protein